MSVNNVFEWWVARPQVEIGLVQGSRAGVSPCLCIINMKLVSRYVDLFQPIRIFISIPIRFVRFTTFILYIKLVNIRDPSNPVLESESRQILLAGRTTYHTGTMAHY